MDNHDSGTGGTGEFGRLLTHLEDKLAELDQLQHDLAQDTRALALALNSATEDRPGTRSIYSIPEAARELGVSTSMLHKLLKDQRLGHLKVGARTLITPEHLERFRAAAEVNHQVSQARHTHPARAIERDTIAHVEAGQRDAVQPEAGQAVAR